MVNRIRTAAVTFLAQNSKAKICIGVSKIAGVGDLPVGKREPGSPETWLETIKVIPGPEEEGHVITVRDQTWPGGDLEGPSSCRDIKSPGVSSSGALKQVSIPGVLTEPDVKTHVHR